MTDLQEPVQLSGPQGASAVIHRHGAHVTSWKPAADQEDRLFLSAASAFKPGVAIRGGVPVIFPQFAGEGSLPKHGFARTSPWKTDAPATAPDGARFVLQDSAATRAIWPHAFRCELDVGLESGRLRLALTVRNTGEHPFSFTAALHTYLRVRDIGRTTVRGLQGLRFRDSAFGGEHRETQDELPIAGEVDRIYFDAPCALNVAEPERQLRIEQQGFADTVVWNPGPQKAEALSDLEPEGWRRMLCVEAAVVGRPVRLEPDQSWQGSQTLTVIPA